MRTILTALLCLVPVVVLAQDPVPTLSDLVPPGGEAKAKDSMYDRWCALVGQKSDNPLQRSWLLDRNFQIRDGRLWAQGAPPYRTRRNVGHVLKRLGEARVVFFGEQHNQAGAHLLEILLLRAFVEVHGAGQAVVVMEMFERQAQPILDAYLAGKMDEATFLASLKDPAVKGLWSNYKDYRPIVEFCRKAGVPVVAGFPPRHLASRLARTTVADFYAKLTDEERKLCATRVLEPKDPAYRKQCMATFASMGDFRRAIFLEMVEKDLSKLPRFKPMILGTGSRGSGMGRVMAGSSERIFNSQLLKDSTMAETVARLLAGQRNRVFVVAGAGHVVHDGGAVGVLSRLRPRVDALTLVSKTSDPAADRRPSSSVEADLLFWSDSIETYVQKMPKRVSLEAARRRVGELEKLALLDVYRKNGTDQRRAMREIEKVRGLAFRYPVAANILTAEEAKAEVGGWAETAGARKELEKKEIVLRGFRLLRTEKSLVTRRAEKNRESILGFYRSTDKTLYIFPQQAGAKLYGLRVHETIHALQDQHFGMAALRARAGNADAQAALTGLIEGEAVYLMMRVLGKSRGFNRMMGEGGKGGHPGRRPMSGKKPRKADYFQEQTLLAYRYGAKFVRALVEKGGWDRVTEAYRKLPRTTAEILHPDRYLAGFEAKPVDLPAVRAGWRAFHEDVCGEATLLIAWKLGGVKAAEAEGAAAGWRGDAYRVEVSLDKPGLYRIIFVSIWHDQAAAGRAHDLCKAVYPKARLGRRGNLLAMVREYQS